MQLLRTLTGISSAQAIHVTAGLLAAGPQGRRAAEAQKRRSANLRLPPRACSRTQGVRLGLDGAHQQPRRMSDSPNRGPVLISSFIALRRAFFSLAM